MKRTITQLSCVLRQSRLICAAIALGMIVSTVSGCGPADPIQQARDHMAAGELHESIELLRDVIGAEPNNPELLFLYGRALVSTGQPGLAGWPLRKAMEDPKWYEKAALLVAGIEIAGGNNDNAVLIYAEILEANPDNMSARLQRANVAARSPRLFEEALAEVDRILEIAPDELGAYKPRILAYLGLNKPEEAGQALAELGERIGEQPTTNEAIRGWHCATMAIFADESGDEPLALERWAGCEKDFSTHANVVAQSVDFHKGRGDLDRALEVAEAAFADRPDVDSGYRLLVADLLRGLGRPGDAEKILLEAVETDDSASKATALLALTEHYKKVGDLVSAADSLERGLTISQKTMGPQPDLIFSLADLLIQIGDGERALELTSQMTVASHRSLVRARVAHERKRYAKALTLYEETTRLWPENPYAPYHAGRAAMSSAQFDRAFKSFLLSIRVQDGATDARMRVGQLMVAEGKPSTAVEFLMGGRAGTTIDCKILVVEIMARDNAPAVGTRRANKLSEKHPEYFGRAIAAAAKGARARVDERDAWELVEPFLKLEFPPVNHLPILQAGVESAPGDEELAQLKPLVERAIESDPVSPPVRLIEGLFFERTGSLDKAADSYRLVLEAEPDHIETLLHLARVVAASEPQGATELVERALALQQASQRPFDPSLFLLAMAEMSESPGAEALFGSALELAPASGQIALRLGTLLEASGGDAERIVSLANRAIRFQQGQGAEDLRDRAQAQL